MKRVHTHYDNLKVARDAPAEVIRAAYKTLSQRFHPDRNPGNPKAARAMAIINSSYDVLSDPGRRRSHDLWILEQEQDSDDSVRDQRLASQSPPQKSVIDQRQLPGAVRGFLAYVLWCSFVIAGLLIWAWFTDGPSEPRAGPKPYQSNPALVRPAYTRPTHAPNGASWPTSADYVVGYAQLHTEGLSTVTVDNTRNDSDVFVKLVSLDGEQAYPVRVFYIPASASFTLNKVTPGTYDIRYRDLTQGGLSRSESFTIAELRTRDGTQYDNLTLTLYKVKHGDFTMFPLSESEF